MRVPQIVIAIVVLAIELGCAQKSAIEPMRVVDLGHALDTADPTWGGSPVFAHKVLGTIDKDGYFAGAFSSDEHFGTHVDAPAHFAANGATVDAIPAERLVRPAVCINVERAAAANVDYQVTPADIQAFERDHGPIPEGAIVLIATGWDRRWPDASQYMNVQGGAKHFPGISADTARLLAQDRKVAAIGIDTASIDHGPSQNFEAHRTSQPLGVYHIENATNLTTLPPSGFTVVVAPIKIKGGSGGPTRVFALLGTG